MKGTRKRNTYLRCTKNPYKGVARVLPTRCNLERFSTEKDYKRVYKVLGDHIDWVRRSRFSDKKSVRTEGRRKLFIKVRKRNSETKRMKTTWGQ